MQSGRWEFVVDSGPGAPSHTERDFGKFEPKVGMDGCIEWITIAVRCWAGSENTLVCLHPYGNTCSMLASTIYKRLDFIGCPTMYFFMFDMQNEM